VRLGLRGEVGCGGWHVDVEGGDVRWKLLV
jgi:hypothetical protein